MESKCHCGKKLVEINYNGKTIKVCPDGEMYEFVKQRKKEK